MNSTHANWARVSPSVVSGQLHFRISSFQGFHDLLTSSAIPETSRGFVWRGHRSSTWKLKSTLQRILDQVGTTPELSTPESRNIFSQSVVEMFKKASRGRRGNNPRTLGMGEDEFWGLGRHYGLATPLLDWTTSPYVAAYFAYQHLEQPNEGVQDNPVVWGLDRNAVEFENAQGANPSLTFFEPTADDNPRVLSQGGLFTRVPLDQSVEDWVANLSRSSTYPFLVRIELSAADRNVALASLRSMNVSPLSLFPDLEGAAMAINEIMELSPTQVLRHNKWQPIP